MYHIVGRERVDALQAESWQEAWEARREEQAVRTAQRKKKQAEDWEKVKQELDSVGGPHLTGLGL